MLAGNHIESFFLTRVKTRPENSRVHFGHTSEPGRLPGWPDYLKRT
ncbi:MAG: hypothetical protein OP8BY_2170 [Candidatus Saccharicenans subterraneus]|uniref:Uncharacterized protein n=1 Tax=Candidatus Saccharicenans subterraneus TaxID=2508984 RepID=A0A3E2BMB4_9BACT|nr:MAG: hypothetical protein OP8BY_2170 [Candidatus Saccharicenans subterraneum]